MLERYVHAHTDTPANTGTITSLLVHIMPGTITSLLVHIMLHVKPKPMLSEGGGEIPSNTVTCCQCIDTYVATCHCLIASTHSLTHSLNALHPVHPALLFNNNRHPWYHHRMQACMPAQLLM